MKKLITILSVILLTGCTKEEVEIDTCQCDVFTYSKTQIFEDKDFQIPEDVMDTVSFEYPRNVRLFSHNCDNHNILHLNEYTEEDMPDYKIVTYKRVIVLCKYQDRVLK